MIKTLIRYIFVGALSLLPLMLVIIFVNFLKNIGVSAFLGLHAVTDSVTITFILIGGLLLIFALIGFSLERYGKSIIIHTLDRIFEKIPAIRTVYSVTKKVASLFSGSDENTKKEVVLVEYPKAGVWVPAYVLNRYSTVNVLFVPTSPNPTSGYTILVEDAYVMKTTLTLEEASSFIISMGADFPKREELVAKIASRR
jgi:uncharacterized membrane protein